MVRNLSIRGLGVLTGLLLLLAFPVLCAADDFSAVLSSTASPVVIHQSDPEADMTVNFALAYSTESGTACLKSMSSVRVAFRLYRENLIGRDTLIATRETWVDMDHFEAIPGNKYLLGCTGRFNFSLIDDDGNLLTLSESADYYMQIQVDSEDQCTADTDKTNNYTNSDQFGFDIKVSDYQVTIVNLSGPYFHHKDAVNPEITITYSTLYTDPWVSTDLPVRIELYKSNYPSDPLLIRTVDTIASEGSNSYDMPLHNGGINDPLERGYYYARVILDPDDVLIETNETNNALNSTSELYTVISGNLYFGDGVVVTFDSNVTVTASGTDSFRLTGTGSWAHTWGTSAIPFSSLYTMVRGENADDGYSTDLNSEAQVDVGSGTLQGSAGGMITQLLDVVLTPAGSSEGMNFSSGRIYLPATVTIHAKRPGPGGVSRINPMGADQFLFSGGTPVTDPKEIRITDVFSGISVFFHGYGLPFYVQADQIDLDLGAGEQALKLDRTQSTPVYVHKDSTDAIADYDFRKYRGFPSNDIVFSKGLSALTDALYINQDGLQGGMAFDASVGSSSSFGLQPKTAFPFGAISWGNIDVHIRDGAIQEFLFEDLQYTMEFTGECPDGNCGDPLIAARYRQKPSYSPDGLAGGAFGCASDGAIGGLTQLFALDAYTNPVEPSTRWGKLDSSEGLYTYEKNDTGRVGALYIPGFIVPKSQAYSGEGGNPHLDRYLFGSRGLKDGMMPGEIHYLNDSGDSNANDGNEFFAGISMGPQFLESGGKVDPGQTELLDATDLSLLFNGNDDPTIFDITVYTKYVIRPGGITGVFNTAFAEETKKIVIYNYELALTRFAFRQVMNDMDEETWIDGSTDLPFPAGLHVAFSSLDITCTGDFAGGKIETEACDEKDNDEDGIVDEGCGQALQYWNIPVSYLGMEFKDKGGAGECPRPNDRMLYLYTLNQVNGIDSKLTMGAFWNPQGEPEEEETTGPAQVYADSPDNDVAGGFGIALEKSYLNLKSSYPSSTRDGFTNLVGKIDVPLFYDLAVHGHFVNTSTDPENHEFGIFLSQDQSGTDSDQDGVPDAYPSVSNFRDLLGNGDEHLSNDPRPRAKYDWPSSKIIKLDYPLLYSRASGSDGPQFTGVKQDTDLPEGDDPVISLYSVPDYLTPERTKLSFGVSADVAALSEFNVDLSFLTEELNQFLDNQLGISNFAGQTLTQLLDGISSNTEDMHNATGGNIASLLTPLLTDALDTLFDGVGVSDEFEALAGLINQAHNAPAMVTSQVEALVHSMLDDIEDRLAAGLSTSLADLYNSEMAGLMAYSRESIDDAVAAGLSGVPSGPDLDILQSRIDTMRNGISAVHQMLADAAGTISAARSAVETVRNNSTDLVSDVSSAVGKIENALTSLSEFTDTNMTDNRLFEPVADVQGYITGARNAIEDLDLPMIADTLEQAAATFGGSIDTTFITDVNQFFTDRLNELDGLMDDAVTNFEDLFATANMGALFDDAVTGLGVINAHIATLNTTLDTLFKRVLEDMDGDGTEDGGFIGGLESRLNYLAGTLETLENMFTDLRGDAIPGSISDWNDLAVAGRETMDGVAAGIADQLAAQGGDLEAYAAAIDTSTDAFKKLVANGLMGMIKAPLDNAMVELGTMLEQALDEVTGGFLPNPDARGIKEFILAAILNSEPVENLSGNLFQEFGVISDYIDNLTGELTSQLNRLITEAVAAVSEGINSQIENITSEIGGGGGGLAAAKIDGYAIVSQEEVERFHLEAEFKFDGDPDPTVYWAALDITSWNAENGKGSGCSMDGDGLVDVAISTRDITADMLGCSLGIKEALLGFTLDGPVPIGIFGYVYTSGELDFETLVLSDMGLEAGIGLIENYLGCKATGRFESYTISAAFYFGKSCDYSVLKRLDPEIAEFLGDRDGLTGVYIRGSAEVPIWNYSCMLKVGVGCDVGAWYFADAPATYGGLLGGSAYGRVACLASLKGSVRLIGAKVGEEYRFQGSGWGAGGVGWCEPSKWKNISKSRSDSWCVTGDAQFEATYNGGWSLDGPSVDCCF